MNEKDGFTREELNTLFTAIEVMKINQAQKDLVGIVGKALVEPRCCEAHAWLRGQEIGKQAEEQTRIYMERLVGIQARILRMRDSADADSLLRNKPA